MLRSILLLLILSCSMFAQMPKQFYAWWNKPIAKGLNLSPSQRQQIRGTVLQYRPRLIDIRAEVAKAEIDLEAEFNHDPVDQTKANQAVERLIAARGDLTRTLSQMSLKMRAALTLKQWQDLQRLRSGPDAQTPTESPAQK